jgi:hypothetical protein
VSAAADGKRFFILVADDDPAFGEAARRIDVPSCEVRWVPCAEFEKEVRRRRPDYVIGNRVVLAPGAQKLFAARARAERTQAVVLHSVPPWALEHVVRRFAEQAERREGRR